jgi:serine protease AprX
VRNAGATTRVRSATLVGGLVLAVIAPALPVHNGSPGTIWDRHASAVVDSAVGAALGAVHVIVTAATGGVDAAAAAVRRANGAVRAPLPIVGGVAATLSPREVRVLSHDPSVGAVTLDRVGRFDTFSFDTTTSGSNFVASTGAGQAWQQGDTGQGIGVAVIDTGMSPMPDTAGRVVWGPDLSGEGTLVDNYGHGTVMGSIIAGNGADSASNPGGAYTGIAPKATVVAVKTAGRNGTVDVSTVLQAMSWVAAYRNQYNIRVLNLSWGTPSTQSPSVDPLDFAVERLWKLGIVVVVSAGNSGPNAGTITKPGDDPVVLTAGAVDDKQNSDPLDDSIPSWSSRGPTAQGLVKPDVVAPGRYITAQRAFGSYIEQTYPKALYSPSYIRGSGTSQAAAVTSGLAALLIQAHPTWTPDQVKAALMHTASPIAGVASTSQGAGRVNLTAALTADPGPAQQQTPASSGLGSIDASRGGLYLSAVCNGATTTIQGEIDVRCEPWNGTTWTGTTWTGDMWTGTTWTGDMWTGTTWTGTAWTGGTWTGGSWYGTAWTGTTWTGTTWTGTTWTGTTWTGTTWTGTTWTGTAWTSAEYDDFLTAFWGNRPAWWQHVSGEVSDPPPSGHALMLVR